jgi:hypothetical protein
MNLEKHGGMVKVRFCHVSGPNTETLWARPVDTNLYQLDNSPFFSYGVSWQEVVEARLAVDQVLEYVRCVKKSGNRTVRVIFQDCRSTDPDAAEVLTGLRTLGCSYEGMQPRMVSVNVPPKVDLATVAGFLQQRSGLQWEYAGLTYEQVTGRIN